ncbi:hypothetical protein F0562_035516 [Nyssa sinensis]|uniref:Uncharacterized protein n=1 Tax=Nyssa sinensis TaxID=561372 RepID=A0A5J5ABD7_9ASTE|nr:hypothetical protein F0562_035516 [Nyssa sinensis]
MTHHHRGEAPVVVEVEAVDEVEAEVLMSLAAEEIMIPAVEEIKIPATEEIMILATKAKIDTDTKAIISHSLTNQILSAISVVDQAADILTKPLKLPVFLKLRKMLGICSAKDIV